MQDLWYTTNNNFNADICNYLSAIARSKSIEKLFIEDLHEEDTGVNLVEVIESITPLFSANLREFCFNFVGITDREAELLATTLSNSTNKSLTKISLYVLQVSDEAAANIYTALADYKLTKLQVSGEDVGTKSYTAISNLLKRPTTLKKLILEEADENYLGSPDDECMEILANALVDNNTLECLNLKSLNGVSKDGVLLFAKALQMNPQSALREIDLSGFYFRFRDNYDTCDDTARVMANALACIPGLKTINVNSLTPFIDIIQRPNTSLENFCMDNPSGNRSFDLGSELGSALGNNTTLKALSFQHGCFSTEASEVLGRSLYSSSTLKYLDLDYTVRGL